MYSKAPLLPALPQEDSTTVTTYPASLRSATMFAGSVLQPPSHSANTISSRSLLCKVCLPAGDVYMGEQPAENLTNLEIWHKVKSLILQPLARLALRPLEFIEDLYDLGIDQFCQNEGRIASGLISGSGFAGIYLAVRPLSALANPDQQLTLSQLASTSLILFSTAFAVNLIRGRNDTSTRNPLRISACIISGLGGLYTTVLVSPVMVLADILRSYTGHSFRDPPKEDDGRFF